MERHGVGMSAHTPGPWAVETDGSWTRVLADSQPNSPVAIVICEPFTPWHANARLIAAAPELLKACEQALGAFEHNWAINWDDLARAIAKAKGTATGNDPSNGTVSGDAESPK